MNKGKVYLVGAGPGDPKLITVKGLECIKQADVLVYDRLVSKRLLLHAKPGCELIFGGKYPEHHILRQEEINSVLVEKALSGKTVTRLKGGDPFVFGRGGEEAEALAQHGISFEIVPGISSSVAVPAYAGIPVTHRDYTTSFAVITGHLKADKAESAIDWEKIACAHGTLIFLMGMEKLQLIVTKLVENRRSPDTPVALVRWGTTSNQATLTGTLENIVDLSQACNFSSPAIIVVGEVVNLREKLHWFENRPLFGKRILLPRTRSIPSALADELEAWGGEVWELPVEAEGRAQNQIANTLIKEMLEQQQFDLVALTSSKAVKHLVAAVGGDGAQGLTGVKVASIGPLVSETARELGLDVTVQADICSIEGLVRVIKSTLA